MKKIVIIIGARPQFIKHFPMEMALKNKIDLVTIHTGQHYDEKMSQVFFDELGMNKPNYMLDVGSHSHGIQTGKMMIAIEEILIYERPDCLAVYGDTNSTLAGALAAAKLEIPLIHIEAGLRSFNKKMPEEINRVLTDHLSNFLFVTSKLPIEYLNNENIKDNIYLVGDLMKDLVTTTVKSNWIKEKKMKTPYYYTTIHRPYNTDIKLRLENLLHNLNLLDKKVVFTVHPRTRKMMSDFDLIESNYKNIKFIKPQGYVDNLSYLFHSNGLITDSGGMQKEAYWLKKNCVTIRTETEWTETLENGWNTLLFEDLSGLGKILCKENNKYIELYGDSDAAEKIASIVLKKTNN